MKVYDSYNYYSSEKPILSDSTELPYEYRVAEVVGWRKKGAELIVRLGSGAGWGFNGFANIDVNTHSKLVERIYTINYLSDSAVKIRMEKDMWSQIVYNGRTNDIVWLDVTIDQ